MGAMNKTFPINSVGFILQLREKGIPYNQVQQIQLEGKTALAAPKLIQEIYVPQNTDETLT